MAGLMHTIRKEAWLGSNTENSRLAENCLVFTPIFMAFVQPNQTSSTIIAMMLK